MSTTSRGPSRRTLVKGAAWSVPVVAVAGAAPAMAASPGDVTLIQTGACKSPGNSCKTFPKGYRFTFSATNTWPCDVTVTNVNITVTSGSAPGTLTVDTPLIVPEGTTPAFEVEVNASNSGNSTFTAEMCFTYEVACRDVGVQEDCTTITVTGTPPDCTCYDPEGSADVKTDGARVETEAVAPPAETTTVEDTAKTETTTVEDTAKTETITPVAPSTDAGTTDAASTTAQP